MRLKNYINEASTSSATNMEMAIVECWNNGQTQYKQLEKSAISICEYLKKQGVSGEAKHMGSGSFSLLSSWSKHGGTDKTPKTDLMIGKYRISLKKRGGSQLVSGAKGETLSIFYSVAEQLNIFDDIKKQFDEYIQQFVFKKKVDRNLTVGKIKKNKSDDEIVIADQMHKEFTNILNEYFNINELFRREIIRETITGNNKFGNSEASATHVLIFDGKGNNHILRDVNDNSFIDSVISKSKIQFSFKSTSSNAFRSISSNLRILVKEDIIDENILKSLFNKLKGFWNKLKHSFFNMLEYFGYKVDMKCEINF